MNDFRKQPTALTKQKPPRCLRGVQAQSDTEIARRVVRDLYSRYEDPPIAAFELRHPDQTQQPVLLGHYLDREWPAEQGGGRILVSPLSIRWTPSGEETQIIDCIRHGLSAELGFPRAHAASIHPKSEWRCPGGECVDPVFVACFGYTPDFGEPVPEAMRERPQDFFDTFLLAAYCRASGRTVFVTEFECA